MGDFDRVVEALERSGVKFLTGHEVLKRYEYDGLRGYRASKLSSKAGRLAAVYPRSTEDVVEVVRLAGRFMVPLVPVGGMTGLMGGAIAVKDSIMVDMREMSKVLEVDVDDRAVLCEAGITLEALDEVLAAEGLMLGHDPWTKPYATVGGSISTNGMGYTAAAYGSFGRQVLGLEVVLPDGSILRIRGVEDRSAGPDPSRLFIGGEGVFGIITKARLRVFPQPEHRLLAGYRFQSFDSGYRAVVSLFRKGIIPTSLEYGEDFDGPSDPAEDYESELFTMFEGLREEVEAKSRRLDEIVVQFGGRRYEDSWAEDFWRRRHDVANRYMEHVRRGDFSLWMGERVFDFIHTSIPASKVPEYRRLSAGILARNGFLVVDRGIWNLPENFSVAFMKTVDDALDKVVNEAAQVIGELVELAHSLGGSMEYCHGVGVKLSDYMAGEWGDSGLELLRRLKKTIDPHNIMNPGKLGL